MNLTKEELYRMEQADIREAVWDSQIISSYPETSFINAL